MKIIRSTFFRKVKSEYGNFDFQADNGFELRSYIDFVSKFIIVEESPIEKKSGIPYTPKLYVINPKNGEVIDPKTFKKYFDYDKKEILSADGKYKLFYQRIHNDETGRDHKEEELIELENNKKITSSKGIVFSKDPLKNALERYYEDQERRRMEQEKIDAQLTLKEHYDYCKKNLVDNRFILGYYTENQAFKLVYKNELFQLFQAKRTNQTIPVKDLEFKPSKSFNILTEFWNNFILNKKWYLDNSPFKDELEFKEDRIIAKFLISEANRIRKEGDFTKDEYKKLSVWENQVYTESIRRSEYKQYCAHCQNPRYFSARYPKCICRDCYKLITDEKGNKLVFYNTEAMGHGCQGYYAGEEPRKEYDSNICYIEGTKYYAEEARFGGIVIQQKE